MPLASGLSMTVVTALAKLENVAGGQRISKLIASQNPGGIGGNGVAGVPAIDSGPSPWPQPDSARAGIMNSFVINRDMQIRATVIEKEGIVLRRAALQKNFTGFKKSSIDMLFGLGLEYDVTNKLGIYFEPTITRSISPVFERGPIKTYPVITTFNVGLSYNF